MKAKCLNKCSCPYVVKHIRSFKANKAYFIYMEYADIGNLQTFIQTKIQPVVQKKIKSSQSAKIVWREDKIVEIFTRLLLGLKEIHSLGVMHRDVKHLNVLLFQDGQVKLGDFGVGNDNNLAVTNIYGGDFMAPEVAFKGKKYSNLCDVYSLGQILHYMIFFKTGNPLGDDITKDTYKDDTTILDRSCIPKVDGISSELRKICENMIRK